MDTLMPHAATSQSFYYFVFLKLHLMHVTSAEMKGGVCASVLISQSYMF